MKDWMRGLPLPGLHGDDVPIIHDYGGKPCIRGLRISVSDVLDYLAGGMSERRS
jgi:hypothetical protein